MSAGIAFDGPAPGIFGATEGWDKRGPAGVFVAAFQVGPIVNVDTGAAPTPAPRRPLGTWDSLQHWQQEEAERYLGLDNDPNARTLFDWIRAFILNGA